MTNSPTDHGHITHLSNEIKQEYEVPVLEATADKGYECPENHANALASGIVPNVIQRDGQLHIGRPEEMVGAHAKRYNHRSVGICYEGGLDENGRPANTRTAAQKHALHALLRSLKTDYPDMVIVGHRDLPWVKKVCPCFDAASEYQDIQPITD